MSEPQTRIVVRPIASPLTLGFLALAVGTFTMAGAELSWIPAAEDSYAGLAVMIFVSLAAGLRQHLRLPGP